jgi:hypothetical protein
VDMIWISLTDQIASPPEAVQALAKASEGRWTYIWPRTTRKAPVISEAVSSVAVADAPQPQP